MQPFRVATPKTLWSPVVAFGCHRTAKALNLMAAAQCKRLFDFIFRKKAPFKARQ